MKSVRTLLSRIERIEAAATVDDSYARMSDAELHRVIYHNADECERNGDSETARLLRGFAEDTLSVTELYAFATIAESAALMQYAQSRRDKEGA